jgi:regulation of enolase protein 1 (concanavalin A-like superfamily)
VVEVIAVGLEVIEGYGKVNSCVDVESSSVERRDFFRVTFYCFPSDNSRIHLVTFHRLALFTLSFEYSSF